MDSGISFRVPSDSKLDWKHYILFTFSALATCIIFLGSKVRFLRKISSTPVHLSISDVPGPKPPYWFNFIGNLPQFLPASNICKQLIKWGNEYPEIFKFVGLNANCICLVSPTLIQQLYKSSDFGHGVKLPFLYDHFQSLHPNGLVNSKGKLWHQQRRILLKSQSHTNIKGYIPAINKHALMFVEELKRKFEDGKTHQIKDLLEELFLHVIMEIISGQNLNTDAEIRRYLYNDHMWQKSVVRRHQRPWLLLDLLWKMDGMSKQQQNYTQEMKDFAEKQIDQRKMFRAKLQTTQTFASLEQKSGEGFICVLDDLLDADIDKDQMVDNINSLATGYESQSLVLHYFCFLIGQNPEAQRLCQQEADEVFENADLLENGQIGFTTANSGLKYIERCIQETMRLYPPFFILGRKIETPISLELKGKNYRIPAGTVLGVSPLMTHHCSEYFPDPEKFDPDRFLPEEVAKRPKCSFIPFSGGPRACLASRLSEIEMKIVVAHLLRNFDIRCKERMEDVKLLPYGMLTPEKDFTFEITSRNLST